MKRSYGEIFIESKVDEDPHPSKKQKTDLTVFNHLPAEILVHHIVPLVSRDWLYVSREWHKIARVCLPSDQRVKFTRTSLMAVVGNNDIIGVKAHLDSRKLTAKDLSEAFIFACTNSFDEIVDLLLKQPEVDPHSCGDVAINNAAIRGDYKLIKRFVNANQVDPNNFLTLRHAVTNGHYNIVKLLLKDKRIDPSKSENTAIIEAATQGHYKIVKRLLKDPRVDPSDQDNLAICRAAESSYKIVKLLMKDQRVNPAANSNWALKTAIDMERYKTVKLLLKDPRVDPNDDSHLMFFPPITRAVSLGHYKILKHLLKDPRSDPTVANHTMIRCAVMDGRVDLVKLLLQHPRSDPVGPGGLESEYVHHDHSTSIDVAVANNNLPMLQLLLADPRVDFLLWSGHAIHRLVMMGFYDTAHALLKDERMVVNKQLFENISRTLHQRLYLADGDFLDLLQLRSGLVE